MSRRYVLYDARHIYVAVAVMATQPCYCFFLNDMVALPRCCIVGGRGSAMMM